MKKLLLLVVIAIFFLTPAGYCVESKPIMAEKEPVFEEAGLKVMTYNIHRGINKDNKLDIDGIAEVVRGSGAGVIALQEVERFSARTGFADQIGYLANKLDMQYAYGKSLNILNGQYGNAILSRYPIEEYKTEKLTSLGETRTVLKARLNVHGKMVTLLNTHLGLDSDERKQQLKEILVMAAGEKNIIIAGDFNTEGKELAAITGHYMDSACFSEGADKPTFVNKSVMERIDYIFASDSFSIIGYEVYEANASDHYPVISVLKFKD